MVSAARRARILVTTSHRPSQRVRSFAKDLAAVLPEAVKLNRGKSSLRDLYYDAVGLGAERVVVVGVWKGNPGTIRVYAVPEPPEAGLKLMSEIVLAGVTLRREIPGSQKVMATRRLALSLANVPTRLHQVLDTLSRSFLASLLLDDSRLEHYDVVAYVEHHGAEGLVLTFKCTGTGRVCGPKLRIVRVVDHVAGTVFRAREQAVLEGRSGGSSG
jgi:U3 small nucleolar ribonucleoprotein protein IMP4